MSQCETVDRVAGPTGAGASGPGSGRDGGLDRGYSLVVLFAIALVFGGREQPLTVVLEVTGGLLLLYALWQRNSAGHLLWLHVLTLLLMLSLPLLQLVPLPFELWQLLPGRTFYAEALLQAAPANAQARPLSLIPSATHGAAFRLLAPLAAFLLAFHLTRGHARALLTVLLLIACFEALLALLQYAGSAGVSRRADHGTAISGSYGHGEQLATLLLLALPLALALLAATAGRTPVMPAAARAHWYGRLAILATTHVGRTAWYFLTVLVLVLGLVATGSSVGIRVTMLGVLLSALVFSGRLGGINVYGWRGTGLAIAVTAGLEIVLAMAWQRIPASQAGAGGLSLPYEQLRIVGEFMPWGSGLGTFGDVAPRFLPDPAAASDYLRWLTGGGVLMALLLTLLLVSYLRQWWWLWQYEIWSTFRFIQVGAGIGLLLGAIVSAGQSSLQVPANAVFFAFVAALFFQRPRQRKRRRRRIVRQRTAPASD